MVLLRSRDREFSLPQISYVDYKTIEMDRVLTAFLARLWYEGQTVRLSRSFDLTIDSFVQEFMEHPEWFRGFADHPDVARRWIETELFDLVNRGRAGEAVAGPRPLHGFVYRFRNPRHSRPYGADEHLYEVLHAARDERGRRALRHLRDFFFAGIDQVTRRPTAGVEVDVETQALLRLMDQVTDIPDRTRGREPHPPLCIGSADLLADDVVRLLCYRSHIPRSVMVDYLKVLLAFHLGLYHLRLLKLLPALVRRRGADPICAPGRCPMAPANPETPHGDCPYRVHLFVDVTGGYDRRVGGLAEVSADAWFRRIPAYVYAHFTVRKLADFAAHLARLRTVSTPAGGWTVGGLLALLGRAHEAQRQPFFQARLSSILDETQGDGDVRAADVEQIIGLGLPPFDTYVEILVAYRGDFHRRYLTECLDSLLLKNRPGALLAQPRARGARRRFVLDSRLLEVLLQIAVLRPGGALGFHSQPIRIDELLVWLRERYGLNVDRLPLEDGFDHLGIEDREALRVNRRAFMTRLRELGFYEDLSDAYVAQTVRPRYPILEGGVDAGPQSEP